MAGAAVTEKAARRAEREALDGAGIRPSTRRLTEDIRCFRPHRADHHAAGGADQWQQPSGASVSSEDLGLRRRELLVGDNASLS
jgi:hypothetical protein